MTVDQVFQLLEKGFTRDDIMKLESVKAEGIQEQKEEPKKEEPKKEEQKKEEQKKEEPKKEEPKKEEPKKEEQKQDPPEKTETEKRLDSIESNIASLLKAIQQQNLKNDHLDTPVDTLEEQTDKIMASIIRPEPAKKGD